MCAIIFAIYAKVDSRLLSMAAPQSRVPVPVPAMLNMPISQILYLFYANAGQHLTFTLYTHTHTDRNRRQARQMHRSNVWQHVLVPIRLTCAQHTHATHIYLYI